MKTKLITGRYKGYEVCYANKGQIFPRDGWYLTKGDDVIYIEDALAQTREETIREIENTFFEEIGYKSIKCQKLTLEPEEVYNLITNKLKK